MVNCTTYKIKPVNLSIYNKYIFLTTSVEAEEKVYDTFHQKWFTSQANFKTILRDMKN
jgi:hypothetical protein